MGSSIVKIIFITVIIIFIVWWTSPSWTKAALYLFLIDRFVIVTFRRRWFLPHWAFFDAPSSLNFRVDPVYLLVHRIQITVDVPHYVHELLVLREFDGGKFFLLFLIVFVIVIARATLVLIVVIFVVIVVTLFVFIFVLLVVLVLLFLLGSWSLFLYR